MCGCNPLAVILRMCGDVDRLFSAGGARVLASEQMERSLRNARHEGGCPARLLTLAKVHCHRVFAPARLPDCLPSAPPLAPLGPRRDSGARHARDRRAGMRSAATGTTFCSKHGISARTAQPRHKRGKRHGLFFTRKRQRRPSPRPATHHHRSGAGESSSNSSVSFSARAIGAVATRESGNRWLAADSSVAV